MPGILRGAHVDASDYTDLYRATRHLGPEVRRAYKKRLTDAAKIGQRAARVKIRSMPAGRRYTALGAGRHYRRARPGVGVGLRSTLAANIKVEVGPRDVAIRQYTRGLRGHNARDLPKVIDRGGYGISGGWRHPVYGHEPQVYQRSWPYFASTMRELRPVMVGEVAQVLDDIKRELRHRSRLFGLGA
jgi:hypothetical protein